MTSNSIKIIKNDNDDLRFEIKKKLEHKEEWVISIKKIVRTANTFEPIATTIGTCKGDRCWLI